LWRRKGKAFCVRQFAWRRPQPKTDKQNVVFGSPPWKNPCGRQRWVTCARQKFFFVKRFTLTMDQTLIVLLKHIQGNFEM